MLDYYFALGDSIASGHGLNSDKTKCNLSTKAYPYKLKEMLEQHYTINFVRYTCSGDTLSSPNLIDLISNPPKNGLGNRLKIL